jgi:hypothetical protein
VHLFVSASLCDAGRLVAWLALGCPCSQLAETVPSGPCAGAPAVRARERRWSTVGRGAEPTQGHEARASRRRLWRGRWWVRPAGVAKRTRQRPVAYRGVTPLGLLRCAPGVAPAPVQAASELCAGRVRQIIDGILAWVGSVFDGGDLACGEGGELCLNLAHLL